MQKLKPESDAADQAAIETVLQTYEIALNASDTDKLLSVFAPDGVFMAPNNPSAVGAGVIRAAYDGILLSDHLRCRAVGRRGRADQSQLGFRADTFERERHGQRYHAARSQRQPRAFHSPENDSGTWKIARYSFAATLPLPQLSQA